MDQAIRECARYWRYRAPRASEIGPTLINAGFEAVESPGHLLVPHSDGWNAGMPGAKARPYMSNSPIVPERRPWSGCDSLLSSFSENAGAINGNGM
jgi:hypothetical protein